MRSKYEDRLSVHDPEFGAFTFMDFIWPPKRRAYTHWFLDQYTDALSKNPGKEMHFIGHSFGTFILASSLDKFENMKFGNVVLAGSVLPPCYPWKDRVERGQVKCIRNYRANCDIPVAILSNGLGWINRNDIGGAGFYGFERKDDNMEEYLLTGGHGAAVDGIEDFEDIGEFIVSGYGAKANVQECNISTVMRVLSNLSPIYVPIIVTILVIGGPVCLLIHQTTIGIALLGTFVFLYIIAIAFRK